MATSYYEILRIAFEFKQDWTEVEVVCGPTSDGTLGVQGSHRKVFPKSRSAVDILEHEIARQDFLVW